MYWQAFRAAPEALVVVNANAVVRLVNVEAERLFRRTGEQLVGWRLEQLLVGDPSVDYRAARAASRAAAVSGDAAVPGDAVPRRSAAKPAVGTSALRLPDGRQCPVDVLMSTLEGDPSGMVVLAFYDQGAPGGSRATLEHRLRRLTAAEQRQERLLADLILAQERERARIAAGVHDDSLQVITAALLRMQQLRKRLHDPDLLEVLGRVEESIAMAADRLRRLIFDFRPLTLERAGLAAAVRDLVSRVGDDTGIQGSLDSQLSAEPPLPARLLLYRITQEALANVGKHADAERVEVKMIEQDGGYLVRITDDGIGISGTDDQQASQPGHLGLVLMRERVAFAGGWLRLLSPPGGGTVVSFWIPRGADPEVPSRPRAPRGNGGSSGGGAR
jgi:signal transduction histidine kinase